MIVEKIREFTFEYPIIGRILSPAIHIRRLFIEKKYERQKKALSNLGRVMVKDPIIAVDEFNGVFALDVHSDLFTNFIITMKFEPKLAQICKKYADAEKDAIDVGANVGFYTVLLAKTIHNQRVFSIEPTKGALRRLHRNIKMNGVEKKVDIFEGVVSDKNGFTKIKTVKGKEEYSSLGEMAHPAILKDKWTSEEVISTTLDDLIQSNSLRPGFVKMDVEGSEHLVFRGAKYMLETHRPVILSEISDYLLKKNGSSAIELVDFIKSYDYEILNPEMLSIRPETKELANMLCIPKEKHT